MNDLKSRRETIVKHEGYEDYDAAGDAYVCDVKDWKIDKIKADKVDHIARDEAVDCVANSPSYNNSNGEQLHKSWSVFNFVLAFVIHKNEW